MMNFKFIIEQNFDNLLTSNNLNYSNKILASPDLSGLRASQVAFGNFLWLRNQTKLSLIRICKTTWVMSDCEAFKISGYEGFKNFDLLFCYETEAKQRFRKNFQVAKQQKTSPTVFELKIGNSQRKLFFLGEKVKI